MSSSKKKYRKRIILVSFIGLLIILRLLLPTIVKNYVNKVLADLPGYTGAVDDIDIALLRGAYVIEGMYLNVVDAQSEVPFLTIPKADISIEWKSLFNGKIVSEIILQDPEVIYIKEDQEGDQEADADDWTKALTDLVPLDINHFEVHRGTVALVEIQAEPNIDLQMNGIELYADNLSNAVEKPGELPSKFDVTAKTFGNGDFNMSGRLDLLQEIPDMDISFSLENSDVRALNDFTKHYARLDFEKGVFNLYGEIVIADSYLKGYVKPFIVNSVIVGEQDSFPNVLWEGLVSFFKFIFKNQRTDTVAMKVPIEGNLDNVETNAWKTFTSILQNAWINAYKAESDDEIDFEDAKREETRKERKMREKKEKFKDVEE